MDDETMRLLFTAKDGRWYNEADDGAGHPMDLEDSDIDFDRIPAIRKLLTPGARNEDLRTPVEAAKVLAGWGDDAGFEYLKYVVGLSDAERERGVSEYELTHIAQAVAAYRARKSDPPGSDELGRVAVPVLADLLRQSMTRDFEFPLYALRDYSDPAGSYREFGDDFRNLLVSILEDRTRFAYKLNQVAPFFERHDPAFLRRAVATYGWLAHPPQPS